MGRFSTFQIRHRGSQYPQGDLSLRDIRPTIHAMAGLGDLAALDARDVLDRVRRWVDQGDGTVYDRVTGLIWEKKTDDASIHDRDNTYTWSTAAPNPDGTVFTAFLNTLNGGATGVGSCTSSDGISTSGGFAGYCDWRLSTVAELQTILLEPYPCNDDPCVDESVFGLGGGFSWSSNTYAGNPGNAWFVYLTNGLTGLNVKSTNFYVRAVRGGL